MSAADLRKLINAFQLSAALHAVAGLGVADLIGDGTRASDELARETGSDAAALYRVLRVLAAAGVLREEEGRRFSLTELGAPLRTDHPESLADWAAFVGSREVTSAWAALGDGIRTGENAFRLVYGTDIWTYREHHPEASRLFDRAMASSSRAFLPALLAAYDFSRFGTIVDVGGGNGELLRAILTAYPNVRGVLFDQPHVVEGVDLGDRCTVVAGSFFDSVPAGGDAYLLKWILHDWADEEAIAILRAIRPNGGTLVVVDRVLAPPNEGLEGKLADVNMFVMPAGLERTRDEFAALFAAAGWRLVDAVPAGALHVIEGAPA